MQGTDIGIDLGTASILVYIKGKGVVLKEPSVVAFDQDTNKILAIGEEARLMIGRTPGKIIAVRPLREGVISDYSVTEKMLKYFIQKAVGKRSLRKPRIAVCVPSGVTEVEKKAVEVPSEIQALLDARAAARAEKNWAESDRLRDEIAAKGWLVKDSKSGQSCTKK